MPPTKQSKDREHPQQTLHHFFRPKSLPGAQPKIDYETDDSSRSRPPQEVIVIDSDSDDAVEFVEPVKVKRRRLSSQNVNIRSSATLNATARPKNFSIFASQKARRNTVKTVASKTEESFGRPSLLVNSSIEDVSPRFGEPFLLLQNDKSSSTVSQLETITSSPKATCNIPSSDSSVAIDLSLGRWEDGDDEDTRGIIPDDDEPNCMISGELEALASPLNDSLHRDDVSVEILVSSEDGLPSGRSCTDIKSSTSHLLAEPQTSLSDESSISNEKINVKANENAFTFLMSSHKENEVWKEVAALQDKKFGPQRFTGSRRKAPFYKVLQGMPIAVDAFQYGRIPGVTAYFLSHAHSDHYTNLSSNWKNGSIYCSEGTANLIVHMLQVDRKWVHALPMDTPTVIPDTGGVTVTLIEANHCPGSCLFFFEGRQTVNAGDSAFKSPSVGSSKIFRYLHCGDFRASPRHLYHPALNDKLIDHVYLDTTYLDPKYTFPPQPLVVSACAELAKRVVNGQHTKERKNTVLSWMTCLTSQDTKINARETSRILVVIGTYSIGKERIAKAIAKALGSKIYCDARKRAILRCQADQELDDLLTSDPTEGFVHLVPLSTITSDHLKIYLDRFRGRYNRLLGFRPTGWTYAPAAGANQLPSISSILSSQSTQHFTFADLEVSRQSTSTLQLYPVPYSEHSSFYELTCFAMSFNWTKMIATVNVGSEASRAKMSKWVDRWQAERKKRGQDEMVPHRHPDYW